MYIEKELETITTIISSREILDRIIKAYKEEMKKEEFEDVEKDYQKSRQLLESILTDRQKDDLKIIENLFMENMQYSIGFGFKKGIYAGFEHFFVDASTKEPFKQFVHDEILTIPNLRRQEKYSDR